METIIAVGLVGLSFCLILVAWAIGIVIGQRHPIKKQNAAPKVPAPKPQPQAQAPQQPQQPHPWYCQNCGAENRLGAKVCAKCGHPKGAGKLKICSHCKTSAKPSAKFCSKCGQPLS